MENHLTFFATIALNLKTFHFQFSFDQSQNLHFSKERISEFEYIITIHSCKLRKQYLLAILQLADGAQNYNRFYQNRNLTFISCVNFNELKI
jgi:hypothetical protein